MITRIYKYVNRYFSSLTVLAIDIIVSVFSSFAAIFCLDLWIRSSMINMNFIAVWLTLSAVTSAIFFYFLRTYRIIIRYSTIRDTVRHIIAVILKTLTTAVITVLIFNASFYLAVGLGVFDAVVSICMLILVRVVMILSYEHIKGRIKSKHSRQRILIYGTGDKTIALITRLASSPHYNVVGVLLYGRPGKLFSVSEKPILGFSSNRDIEHIKDKYDIDAILFAKETDAQEEHDRLIKYATANYMTILLAPSIDEVIDGRIMKQSIREIKIEDLLGRPEIKISMNEIVANFQDKVVMVTGAAGSIGSELCRQLANFKVKEIVLFDNAETPMHNLRLELEERFPNLKFTPIIGDVRSEPRLDFAFRSHHPQVVFHAAAYKHVPLMEENPCEAVWVNVLGSRLVADKCIQYDVEKMVMISTDKAVNPTNIMGCTKRLAEIYVQSLGLSIAAGEHEGKTKFVTTRFGNVLGSNGSVIPRFREQIAKGGPVTVTHPDITRFFMTIPEACRLVMEAATMSRGNEIFVFDMGESVKIDTLARRMIELAGFKPDVDIAVEYTGLRPGEKLYEEVLSNTENTVPTSHDRIRIAKVREYAYKDALEGSIRLSELAKNVEIPEMVRLMKKIVPEYKSNNSQFEKYDKE